MFTTPNETNEKSEGKLNDQRESVSAAVRTDKI